MDNHLTALALVCTLTPSPEPSSSEKLAKEVLDQLAEHGVVGESVRVVDLDVRFGVADDMGDGDEWPRLRSQVLDCDILVLATPIWLGQPASVAKLVLERLNHEVSVTDEAGRPAMTDKVAVVAVVGNEDGAHHSAASLFQGLDDIGFTIPAQGVTYWVGEAMQGTDYLDLDQVPDPVATTTATVARNARHLAGLLRDRPYPAA